MPTSLRPLRPPLPAPRALRRCRPRPGVMSPSSALHVETPLIYSNPLSAALGTGAPVFLKLEAMQPCGSFKLRGLGAAAEAAVRGGATRLVSSSGGNAGLAVAHAARALGVPATVVLPRSTPDFVRRRLESYGAAVQARLRYGAITLLAPLTPPLPRRSRARSGRRRTPRRARWQRRAAAR